MPKIKKERLTVELVMPGEESAVKVCHVQAQDLALAPSLHSITFDYFHFCLEEEVEAITSLPIVEPLQKPLDALDVDPAYPWTSAQSLDEHHGALRAGEVRSLELDCAELASRRLI